jgi:hypothetical protein
MSRFLRRHSTVDVQYHHDPLSRAIAPPVNETTEERQVRLLTQAEAQRRSDAIDEEINEQRIADRKATKCVRVLLLGKNLNYRNPEL